MNSQIDNFMPQYFESKVIFDAKTKLDIYAHGNGLNQVILKFLLPYLPHPLKYKTICVYDLIKKITLRIGGKIFFKHNSKQLALLDSVERNSDQIRKLISIDNNQILYPIDLSNYFKKCRPDSSLDGCIRLSDCKNCKIIFEIKIGSILNLIQNVDGDLDYGNAILYDRLCNLNIIDAMAYAYYLKMDKKQDPNLNVEKIISEDMLIHNIHDWFTHNIFDQYFKIEQQNICWWGDVLKINDKNCEPRTHRFHNIGNNMNISKVIIHSTQLHLIEKFTVNVINSLTAECCCININPLEFKKIINYNSNFTPINHVNYDDPNTDYIDDDNILFFDIDPQKNQEISFDILLSKSDEIFVLDYMYKISSEIIYHEDHLESKF